jgi:hypothetical protein
MKKISNLRRFSSSITVKLIFRYEDHNETWIFLLVVHSIFSEISARLPWFMKQSVLEVAALPTAAALSSNTRNCFVLHSPLTVPF